MTEVFRDTLGREIKIGDVLAVGQRQGLHGGIKIGVVTGFTEKSILADALQGDYMGWDHTKRQDTSWTFYKSKFLAPYNCFITGLTRSDLEAITTTLLWKENPVTDNKEII